MGLAWRGESLHKIFRKVAVPKATPFRWSALGANDSRNVSGTVDEMTGYLWHQSGAISKYTLAIHRPSG